MKKIVLFIMSILLVSNIFAFNMFDLSDDTVLARVDDINITLLDFKMYSLGYKSIDVWDENSVGDILNIMIMDLLFKTACDNEKIFISESALSFYAYKYFNDRSLPIDDAGALKIFFDMNDPYYNIEDFMIKSTYNLYKVKYLSETGEISTFKSYMIYFSTKNKNNKKKQEVKEKAVSLVYEINNGDTPFSNFVKNYSDDEFSKQKDGDIGEINYEEYKKIFTKKEFDKVLKAGIFQPVFLEGKDGFYIFMNYDYQFADDTKVVEKILLKLSEKYKVIKMINFNIK